MERELISTFIDENHLQHYRMKECRTTRDGFTINIEYPDVIIRDGGIAVLSVKDGALVEFTIPEEN